jgi:hypothetical protein
MTYALVVFSVLVLANTGGNPNSAIVNTNAPPQVVEVKRGMPQSLCTSAENIINNTGAPDLLDGSASYGIAFKANCLPEP